MQLDNAKVKDLLLRESYITAEDIAKAEKFAEEGHISLVDALLQHEIISKQLLGQAIAESFHTSFSDITERPPSRDDIIKLPEDIARKYSVIFLSDDGKMLSLATVEPTNGQMQQAVTKQFPGRQIHFVYAFPDAITPMFDYYSKPLATRFSEIIQQKQKVAPEIIDEIVKDAVLFHASDIHFEPQSKEVVIRFRVDGLLHEAGRIPKDYYDNILNRIKVQCGMRIDEHFAAQDGAIRLVTETGAVDMRVSVIPTLDGEKIAIRLLSAYVANFTFSSLGLSDRDRILIDIAAKKPFGMILVVGPTGSGKTTTLYALLRILDHLRLNITTIEDPVEYRIEGVNQIQVNPKTNLTFAEGLRSIVRQDPDVVLVGEIRDLETAEIAVNAALTGHLLMSTFHANDAATAVPRLLDLGVEPFLLASTLNIIVAQRLARKICEYCRYSYVVERNTLDNIIPHIPTVFPQEKITLYKGKGCKACNNAGYKGRVALFEIIEITQDLQDLMLKNPSAKQIWEVARAHGSRKLFEDGLEKVKNGVTTIEEVLRVAPPSTKEEEPVPLQKDAIKSPGVSVESAQHVASQSPVIVQQPVTQPAQSAPLISIQVAAPREDGVRMVSVPQIAVESKQIMSPIEQVSVQAPPELSSQQVVQPASPTVAIPPVSPTQVPENTTNVQSPQNGTVSNGQAQQAEPHDEFSLQHIINQVLTNEQKQGAN
jgi:type IV pilus assembly protein PilB